MTADRQKTQQHDTQIVISAQNMQDAENSSGEREWYEIRTEGVLRFERITQIFNSALSAIKAELKLGSERITPIAKDLSAQTVRDVKKSSTATLDDIRQTWESNPDKTIALRSVFLSFARSLKAKLLPWYRSEIRSIDQAFKKTVGDR